MSEDDLTASLPLVTTLEFPLLNIFLTVCWSVASMIRLLITAASELILFA